MALDSLPEPAYSSHKKDGLSSGKVAKPLQRVGLSMPLFSKLPKPQWKIFNRRKTSVDEFGLLGPRSTLALPRNKPSGFDISWLPAGLGAAAVVISLFFPFLHVKLSACLFTL